MSFPELRNKVAIVTGASGGIGSAVVNRLREHGVRVYGTDIRDSADSCFIKGDIADAGFIAGLVAQVVEREHRIDILINNAGICPRTALLDINEEEWLKVMDVNLKSAFLLSQACMREMMKNKSGTMVNLASMAGKVGGIAVGAHYSASKAALGCLTKSLARCGAPSGIRVNAVAPGVIDTEITKGASPEQMEGFRKSIPLGRIGRIAEVVEPILFLLSDSASYMTGVTIDINGGLLMD